MGPAPSPRGSHPLTHLRVKAASASEHARQPGLAATSGLLRLPHPGRGPEVPPGGIPHSLFRDGLGSPRPRPPPAHSGTPKAGVRRPRHGWHGLWVLCRTTVCVQRVWGTWVGLHRLRGVGPGPPEPGRHRPRHPTSHQAPGTTAKTSGLFPSLARPCAPREVPPGRHSTSVSLGCVGSQRPLPPPTH